jgi:anthranilate phosphoribosyltransferase
VIQEAIRALVDGGALSGGQAAGALTTILTGAATPAQIAAFLTALRTRGETPEVIAACLGVTEAHAEHVPAGDVIDIVGTGGDGADTFNVSTAAGIVAAACGLRVAKHGNRAASSRCGSADVLEALGANLDLSGPAAASIVDACGFCFLFAQRFHPAFRHAGPPRREIGIRTLFNIIGPLSNPARPRAMLVGCSVPSLGPVLAEALRLRGLASAMVVHSTDGLDEISPAVATHAWLLEDGVVSDQEIGPADFGLPTHALDTVLGGDAPVNAASMRAVLDGGDGPITDFVLLNAAAALKVAGRVTDYLEGVDCAREAIQSGRARHVLADFIQLSQDARDV